MQDTLDMGQIVSDNVVLVKVEEEFASMQASSSKTEVPGKIILGYICPSRYGV